MRRSLTRALLALVALALGWGLFGLPGTVRQAQAIIGRPLTPMSYAGVARRTTRRAVYATSAASAYNYYW